MFGLASLQTSEQCLLTTSRSSQRARRAATLVVATQVRIRVRVRGSLEAKDKQAEKHTAQPGSADGFLSLVRNSSGAA
jgi:hypothetical protein